MVRIDLAVLAGVGILALACLVACGMYVYRCSDSYRARKRRTRAQRRGGRTIPRLDVSCSQAEATIGTQLSDRCRTSLYRVMFGHADDESIVFLMAASRDAAQKEATEALAAIHCITPDEVCLHHLASFRELIASGVSEDEDLRLFEVARHGPDVSLWAEHPLFLTDDSTLLGKWAELYADLARQLAANAISRARA
ncbi:hypothetical protein SAMN05216466_107164 [Paraburkholderia phenazinium]|uniref:Uncharacterized protein n=1 Tax=Paraburkholderia phenazinium TaxID=60549 RepID=A0A1G7ZT70_9BURK|nr:hypothetical protein [Paraburkholderia phenazinium]SDH11871.1 hypothetical protein SAMN05216466_107164 [Paraburkholderia phenazinium]